MTAPLQTAAAGRFGLRFHHLGWVVQGPEAADGFLGALGYRFGARAFDPLQNVNLAMRHHAEMPDVELIWPGPEPGPVDRLLRGGHMVYHIGYVTDGAAASLAAMEAAGADVMEVSAPRPAALFGGVEVSFHTVAGVGLIELIHGEPRPVRDGAPA